MKNVSTTTTLYWSINCMDIMFQITIDVRFNYYVRTASNWILCYPFNYIEYQGTLKLGYGHRWRHAFLSLPFKMIREIIGQDIYGGDSYGLPSDLQHLTISPKCGCGAQINSSWNNYLTKIMMIAFCPYSHFFLPSNDKRCFPMKQSSEKRLGEFIAPLSIDLPLWFQKGHGLLD